MNIAIAGLAALIAARSVFFLLALIGTISSTVFLVLVLLASIRHLRLSRHMATPAVPSMPPVTLLKPVHGAEPRLRDNLESYFLQDYRDFEIVFGARSLDNDAVKVVSELRKKYPQVKSSLVISGEPEWHNAKVYSLDKMIASTPNSYFIITDSDILVEPDFISRIIPPLLDPKVGCVTAMYKGVPAPEFWSSMEALGMSVEMPSGVMIVD